MKLLPFVAVSCVVIAGRYLGWLWLLRQLCQAIVAGGAFVVGVVIIFSRGAQRTLFYRPKLSWTAEVLSKIPPFNPPRAQHSVGSRALDRALQEVLELLMRDYMFTWYKEIGQNEDVHSRLLMQNLWFAIEKLSERLKAVDWVKLLTDEMVVRMTRHLQDLKHCQHHLSYSGRFPETSASIPGFFVHSCVESEMGEIRFLRRASDVLLFTLLPESHVQCASMRALLRELLVFKVFRPMVDSLCDPDYINQTLVNYLQYRESLTSKSSQPGYEYAPTYEDFIKIIRECESIAQLEQIRYKLIGEIMLVTATLNLNTNTKGMSPEERRAMETILSEKGYVKDRNLRRYFNNCKVAKTRCEQRIKALGGPNYMTEEPQRPEDKGQQGKSAARKKQQITPRVMTFKEVMEEEMAYAQLLMFMQRSDKAGPLFFWLAVEELKLVDMSRLPSLAQKVYDAHLAQNAPDPVHIDRQLVRGVEAFLQGAQGPESLFAAQDQIYDYIQEEHYQSFLLSDLYYEYISQLQGSDPSAEPGVYVAASPTDAEGDSTQSVVVQKKLEQLKQKEAELEQTKQSAKTAVASPSLTRLENEVDSLKQEIQELQSHKERTDQWFETMGNWQVEVVSAQLLSEKQKGAAVLTIMVHQSMGSERPNSPPPTTDEEKALRESEREGWVLARQLYEFQNLHESLKMCQGRADTAVLRGDLPLPAKPLIWQRDRDYLDRMQQSLQAYLQALLSDEFLRSNEDLYRFLCPGPEERRRQHSRETPDKSFSFLSLLKSLPVVGGGEDEDEDPLALDEADGRDRRDSIAEPLYALVSEIFELHGLFKWLRRQLMVFVQATFGGTINRQIHETVQWIVGEEMLVYYIHNFRDSWWPEGELAAVWATRSDEEKARTRDEAHELLMKNLPAILESFVGQNNCKCGANKMFEALQDARSNKHLFYVYFELFMFVLFPEMRSSAIVQAASGVQQERMALSPTPGLDLADAT